jgi:hypothetical protein
MTAYELMFQGLNESAIAADFAARVRDYVGLSSFHAIRELNAAWQSDCVCASHDYCDSNEFLFAALCDAVPGLFEASEAEDTESVYAAMSPAWSRIHAIATREHFTA